MSKSEIYTIRKVFVNDHCSAHLTAQSSPDNPDWLQLACGGDTVSEEWFGSFCISMDKTTAANLMLAIDRWLED